MESNELSEFQNGVLFFKTISLYVWGERVIKLKCNTKNNYNNYPVEKQ